MPEFVDVASHFDDVSVYDAYTNALLFNAQFNSFDESSADGSIVKKRTMSTRPGIAMPTRRVIKFVDEVWIVGDGNTDAFQNEKVRAAYWMKKATELGAVLTPAQACSGAAGTALYLHRAYLKDTVNSGSDSEYDPFWNIYISQTEPIEKGYFFRADGRLFRVRATPHLDLNGMTLAASDEIDPGSEVSVVIGGQTYDPISDTYTGSPVTVAGLLFDMYKNYELKTDADPKMHSGDMTLLVPNTTAVVTGASLTIGTQRWQVIARTTDVDAWNLHVRRQ